jgi:hypothetical protein
MRSNISLKSFVSSSNNFSLCLYALKRKKNIVFVKILFICGNQEILKKFNNILFSYFIPHIFIGLNSGDGYTHSDKLNKSNFVFVYYLGHDFH